MKAYSLSLFALALAMQAAPAQPDPAVYQLKVQCGQQAAAQFSHDYGDGKSDSHGYSHGYVNHYNAKLNSCFSLTTSVGISDTPKGRKTTIILALDDLTEHFTVGEFWRENDKTILCHIDNIKCYVPADWDVMVKSYMGD